MLVDEKSRRDGSLAGALVGDELTRNGAGKKAFRSRVAERPGHSVGTPVGGPEAERSETGVETAQHPALVTELCEATSQ